jgi:ComF family protein
MVNETTNLGGRFSPRARLRRAVHTLRSELAQWFAPSECVLCGDSGLNGTVDLCAACDAELPEGSDEPMLLPEGTDACRCCFRYELPVDVMLRRVKFQRELYFARVLGEACARRISNAQLAWPRLDVLVPVPLHHARLAKRGFNQAAELARPLAAVLGCELLERAAIRRRATREQSSLARNERAINLQGAFEIRGAVAGLRLLIVDDVITTGATLGALATALKAAGAASVFALGIARA